MIGDCGLVLRTILLQPFLASPGQRQQARVLCISHAGSRLPQKPAMVRRHAVANMWRVVLRVCRL
jgi:hypothetical protein